MLDTITREVAKGNKVAITGFGSFEKSVRNARWVRNPQTGARIKTKKKAVPKFSPGADLKNVVSGAKKLPKLLACFTVDDPSIVLLGRETIFRNGKQVGYLTSGGFGYTIGKPIGFGYIRDAQGLTDDFIRAGRYELIVAQDRVPCKLSLGPLYDPANARVRA